MRALPELPLACYRLIFAAIDPVRLPEYSGSTWRGAFGHALKRLVCVTREPTCPPCLLYRSCLYPYLFETPPDPAVGKLRKYPAAPHPFVFIPDQSRHLAPGETLSLAVTLFGHGNRHFPYVLHALDQAGQRGLGRQGGRLQLQSAEQMLPATHWQPIYTLGGPLTPQPPTVSVVPPCPQRLTVTLVTPLRLKVDDRNVTPERFRFSLLFSNLLRRISLLTAFHTDTPLETDFAGLSRTARTIELQSAELHWQDWTRYSARQDTAMQMGGLVGRITLAGAELEPFWPYLWLGQWTHAGKGATMGLGRYRIERS